MVYKDGTRNLLQIFLDKKTITRNALINMAAQGLTKVFQGARMKLDKLLSIEEQYWSASPRSNWLQWG